MIYKLSKQTKGEKLKNRNLLMSVLSLGFGSVLAFVSSSCLAADQLTVIQAGMTADKFKVVQDAIVAGMVKCAAETNQPHLNQVYIQELLRRDTNYMNRNSENLKVVQDAIKANLVQCIPENNQPQLNHSYIQELQRKGVIRNVGMSAGSRCF